MRSNTKSVNNSLILLNLVFPSIYILKVNWKLIKPSFCKGFNQVGTQYKMHEIYIRNPQKHRKLNPLQLIDY